MSAMTSKASRTVPPFVIIWLMDHLLGPGARRPGPAPAVCPGSPDPASAAITRQVIRPRLRIGRGKSNPPMTDALNPASRADALVLFGATGDLAFKKIFPALQSMAQLGQLDMP